jgi:hypothetical protein
MTTSPDLQAALLAALRESSDRIALLTAEWMRVGFCQGNFNSDNCLVSGRTMDYGTVCLEGVKNESDALCMKHVHILMIWVYTTLLYTMYVFMYCLCVIAGPFGFIERYERGW